MQATSEQEMLIGSAARGDIPSVEALLKDGVDPNGIIQENGKAPKTALDVAATLAIQDLLLAHGGKSASDL